MNISLQAGKFCYHTDDSTATIVVQDTPGYYVTDYTFATPDAASAFAKKQNENLNLSNDRVAEIIASSMKAQNTRFRRSA